MRIALVAPEFPPDVIGGGGTVYAALAREYSRRNRVRVFSAQDSVRKWWAKPSVEHHDPNSTVIRYPLVPMFRHEASLRSVLPPNPIALKTLLSDLLEWAPDVAHLHGLGYAIVDVCAAALHKKGIPYVVTSHGLPNSPRQRSPLVRLCYETYERTVLSSTVTKARATTAVSSVEARTCESVFKRDFNVIPNGIEQPSDQGALTHLPFELPNQPFIAAAGRFVANKGFEVLLEALEQMSDPPTCIIAGDWQATKLGQAIKSRQARSTVMLPGLLSKAQLRTLFMHAKAVIVPSLSEPFGLVGFEALAVGTRVIASKTGGLWEYAIENTPISFVQVGSVIELATAIDDAMGSGPLSDLEQDATCQTLEHLTWESIAMKYEKMFETLSLDSH